MKVKVKLSNRLMRRIKRAIPEEKHAIKHYTPLKHVRPFGEILRDEQDHLRKIDRFLGRLN